MIRANTREGVRSAVSTVTVVASAAIYAVVVSRPVQALCSASAAHGWLSATQLQYTAILSLGAATGWALRLWLVAGWQCLLGAVSSSAAATLHWQRQARGISAAVLGFGLVAMFALFPAVTLHPFIDTHRGVRTEIEVLLYLMGVCMAGAWTLLRPQAAWWGLLLTPTMALMVASGTLATHSWG